MLDSPELRKKNVEIEAEDGKQLRNHGIAFIHTHRHNKFLFILHSSIHSYSALLKLLFQLCARKSNPFYQEL